MKVSLFTVLANARSNAVSNASSTFLLLSDLPVNMLVKNIIIKSLGISSRASGKNSTIIFSSNSFEYSGNAMGNGNVNGREMFSFSISFCIITSIAFLFFCMTSLAEKLLYPNGSVISNAIVKTAVATVTARQIGPHVVATAKRVPVCAATLTPAWAPILAPVPAAARVPTPAAARVPVPAARVPTPALATVIPIVFAPVLA